MTLQNHKWAKLPLEHIKVYLEDCLLISPYIISVGCGNGAYEYEISEGCNQLREKLILVDPNPEEFSPYPSSGRYIKVNYSTVNSLVSQVPNVIENCVLLLIWPYDDGNTSDNSVYDYEAVTVLKPKSIIVVYERPDDRPTGASGGSELCQLLSHPEKLDYRCISMTRYRFLARVGALYPKISWLAKKGSLVPKKKNCLELQVEADKIADFSEANDPGACSVS